MTDSDGHIVWEMEYSAFGEELRQNEQVYAQDVSGVRNNIRFGGKPFEEIINLYYFNARWYDAANGRFTTEDPAKQGNSWFVYSSNNPLVYVDPTGLYYIPVSDSEIPDNLQADYQDYRMRQVTDVIPQNAPTYFYSTLMPTFIEQSGDPVRGTHLALDALSNINANGGVLSVDFRKKHNINWVNDTVLQMLYNDAKSFGNKAWATTGEIASDFHFTKTREILSNLQILLSVGAYKYIAKTKLSQTKPVAEDITPSNQPGGNRLNGRPDPNSSLYAERGSGPSHSAAQYQQYKDYLRNLERNQLVNGVPQKAHDTLDHIDRTGNPPHNYRGRRTYTNRNGTLPRVNQNNQAVSYREWDVEPNQPGVNRGTERIVTGSDGSAYYTNDHYSTFTRIR